MPTTPGEWEVIAAKFLDYWNFPNCIVAVDGKHVVMIAPPDSGSLYYSYELTHSIILMAIRYAEYSFIYIDGGANGRISDGGVFGNCSFAAAINNEDLNLPEMKPLPGRSLPVPYVLVGDDAFPLKPNMMKPYPGRNLTGSQRVYNYRTSRARRTIENAFGLISARFRVLRSAIHGDAAKTAEKL